MLFVTALALVFAAAAPAAGGAASGEEAPFDRPAAVVNGETITVRMVEEYVERTAHKGKGEATQADFDQALATLINRRLLIQAAERDLPEHVRARLRALAVKRARERWDPRSGEEPPTEITPIYEDYLIQAYLEKKVYRPLQVSPGEVRAYYERNIDAFKIPATVTIRQILVREWERTSEEAESIIKKAAASIDEGADFAELARQFSQGPYAAEGGLWPPKTPDELIEPVAAAAAALSPGEVSDPFHSPLGWHLVKVEARSEERTMPFSEVQDDVHERLAAARRSQGREALMKSLRSRAVIRILVEQRAPSAAREARPGNI